LGGIELFNTAFLYRSIEKGKKQDKA
jgi:hypothetical protein